MSKKGIQQYAKALYEITKDLPQSRYDVVAKEFLALLKRDGKLSRVDQIIEEFIRHAEARAGIRRLEIVTARETSEAVLKKVQKAFGERTVVETHVDPTMLGGVRIRIGDIILDASLKAQLKRLKQHIIS